MAACFGRFAGYGDGAERVLKKREAEQFLNASPPNFLQHKK
jgi:hypothetical protein